MDWEFLKKCETLEETLSRVRVDQRTLSEWLMDYIESRDIKRGIAIKKSLLNQTFAYQIFSGARRPSRDKLIQLAFGLGMGPQDASRLLERGGANALLTSCRRDVIIAFCLEKGLGIGACEDMLWAEGEKTLT